MPDPEAPRLSGGVAVVRRRARFRHSLLGLAVGAAVALLLVLLRGTYVLQSLELKTVDLRFRTLHDVAKADTNIVIVDVDNLSLDLLRPTLGRYPWPRDAWDALVRFLAAGGAKAVGFDFTFPDPDLAKPARRLRLRRVGAGRRHGDPDPLLRARPRHRGGAPAGPAPRGQRRDPPDAGVRVDRRRPAPRGRLPGGDEPVPPAPLRRPRARRDQLHPRCGGRGRAPRAPPLPVPRPRLPVARPRGGDRLGHRALRGRADALVPRARSRSRASRCPRPRRADPQLARPLPRPEAEGPPRDVPRLPDRADPPQLPAGGLGGEAGGAPRGLPRQGRVRRHHGGGALRRAGQPLRPERPPAS